jgi:hypothetical protein
VATHVLCGAPLQTLLLVATHTPHHHHWQCHHHTPPFPFPMGLPITDCDYVTATCHVPRATWQLINGQWHPMANNKHGLRTKSGCCLVTPRRSRTDEPIPTPAAGRRAFAVPPRFTPMYVAGALAARLRLRRPPQAAGCCRQSLPVVRCVGPLLFNRPQTSQCRMPNNT